MTKRSNTSVSVITKPRGRPAKAASKAVAKPAKPVKPSKAVTKPTKRLTPGQKRAIKAWETRRANLYAKGLIDEAGTPTRKEAKRRRAQALKAWATRRLREAA